MAHWISSALRPTVHSTANGFWTGFTSVERHVDQAIAPPAYGRLTANGTAFEPWDLFVRFRSLVWTGETERWQKLGDLAVSAAWAARET
jgi:hypothetical protein